MMHRQMRALVACAALLILLAGCASDSARFAVSQLKTEGLPTTVRLPVQFTPQRVNHCGPAVLSMAANFATGAMPDVNEVATHVFTPGREGTLRYDLMTGARRMGLLAVRVEGFDAVLAEVAAGNPVILFENAGLSFVPFWHFSLLVGYDLETGLATLHSDQDAFTTMSLDRLGHIWTRGGSWALVVTQPDTLPNVKDITALLDGASGLSRVGETAAAHKAFQLIAHKFPASAIAQFSYGNAAFAQGRLNEAAQAYRQAITLGDVGGQAHNNLAYVLAKQGDNAAACKMARQAQQIAPHDSAPADTARELCGAPLDSPKEKPQELPPAALYSISAVGGF